MSAKDIRNIVLLGHSGSGKTTLAESMLYLTGGTDRLGRIADGNIIMESLVWQYLQIHFLQGVSLF